LLEALLSKVTGSYGVFKLNRRKTNGLHIRFTMHLAITSPKIYRSKNMPIDIGGLSDFTVRDDEETAKVSRFNCCLLSP